MLSITLVVWLLSNEGTYVDADTCTTSSFGGKFSLDYGSSNCAVSSGVVTLACQGSSNCGARASSVSGYGKGLYYADIRAAPGPGVVTTFYLYSYGRNNGQTLPWNEVDIEILGDRITSTSSVIWTNWWIDKGVQFSKAITVPWDASSGYHSYGIRIDEQNIEWVFDGTVYRSVSYSAYSDFVSTVNNYGFQALISLWSDSAGSFGGNLNANSNSFPLKAYYKSIVLAQYQHTVALKSTAHSRYVRARDDLEVDIDATAVGTWEKFKVYRDQYLDAEYIESWMKMLLTAEHDSEYTVRHRTRMPQSWESWKIAYNGAATTVSALSFSPSRYLRARDDLEVDADATAVAAWEKYEFTWL